MATFLSPCSGEICCTSSPLYAGGLISSMFDYIRQTWKKIVSINLSIRNRTITESLGEIASKITVELLAQWSSTRFYGFFLEVSVAPSVLSTSSSRIKKLSCFGTQPLIVHRECLKRTFPMRYLLHGTKSRLSRISSVVVANVLVVYWEKQRESVDFKNIDELIASKTWSFCYRSFTKSATSRFLFPRTWRTLGKEGKGVSKREYPRWRWLALKCRNSTRCYLSPRSGVSHQRCISDQLTTLFQLPLFVWKQL